MAMRNRPLAQQTLSEEAENLVIPQLDTPPRIERPLVEQAFEDDHVQPSATQSNEPPKKFITCKSSSKKLLFGWIRSTGRNISPEAFRITL
ncbi:hypothetical protein LB505_000665 [Fusarium chuoi]|nr:hypothetical protein LB505_000665 [Fusarium chuoi]